MVFAEVSRLSSVWSRKSTDIVSVNNIDQVIVVTHFFIFILVFLF